MCLAWDIGNDDTSVNTQTCTTRRDGTAETRRDGTCFHGPQTGTYKDMHSAVVAYAANQATFLTDFAAAWQKLMELTPNTLVAVGQAQSAATAATTTTATTTCSDTPNTYMTNNGKTCATWTWGINNNCNKKDTWIAAKYCQQSCFTAGHGYEGDSCSALVEEDQWEERVTPLPDAQA